MVIAERPFTSFEAADWLQMHPMTVVRLARERKLKGYKVSNEWRFYLSDLEAYVKGGYDAA